MSCNYTIDGKSYTEEEYINLVKSNEALLSTPIKDLSDEQLRLRGKQIADKIFVNHDLFKPVQEASYTNVIFSEAISQLMKDTDFLQPGQKIDINPDKLFSDIREKFLNGKKKFDNILELVGDEDGYNAIKEDEESKEEFMQHFPEVFKYDYAGLQTLAEQYGHVTENFDGFKERVIQQFASEGLQIKGNRLVDVGQTQESKDSQNTAPGQNGFTEVDRVIAENWDEGSHFQTNPRDTASAAVKLFLYNIPTTEKNIFNMTEFVDPHEAFNKLLSMGSKINYTDYDTFRNALNEEAKQVPYLDNLGKMLDKIRADKNESFINQFLTVLNKAYVEHVMVTWDHGTETSGGLSVKTFNANRNTIINQVRKEWMESQKNSSVITENSVGNKVVNRDTVKELRDSFNESRKSSLEQKKVWVSHFFSKIGIDFNSDMVDDLEKSFSNRRQNQFKGLSKSFEGMFREGSVFDSILKKYETVPDGGGELTYESGNNAMLDENTSFNAFAALYANRFPNGYQTPSACSGEGKSLYPYVMPSYLEDVRQKIQNGKDYLETLTKRAFSKSSDVISKLTDLAKYEQASPEEKVQMKNADPDYVMQLFYMDSLKHDAKNEDAKVRKNMSVKEQFVDMILKFQNQANDTGYFNGFTLSDKDRSLVAQNTKFKLNKATHLSFVSGENKIDESFEFKTKFKEHLFDIAKSEINRMIEHAKLDPEQYPNLKDFNDAQKLFYIFPSLNNLERYPELKSIHDKIFSGKLESADALSTEEKRYVGDILGENFKENVKDSFKSWQEMGIFTRSWNENKKEYQYNFPLFDEKYVAKKLNGSGFEKAVQAIVDQKVNSLRVQTNLLQLLSADPALFYKDTKVKDKDGKVSDRIKAAVKDGNIQNAAFEDKKKTIQSSWMEFVKRAAAFIAPGSKGVGEWMDEDGNKVDRRSYNNITLKTVKRDTKLFDGVDVTDAQELLTVQEHIDRMMSKGDIDDKSWNSITKKIEAAKKDGSYHYTLTPEEKSAVNFQPTKPVYVGSSAEGLGYVKSSTYVMIPEMIQGSPLNDLRKMMEQHSIAAAAFDSAQKLGQPIEPLEVFHGETGEFLNPKQEDIQRAVKSQLREGLRTQQEIPKQKSEISTVSQLNRNLFDGVLDVNDFSLPGKEEKEYSGRELKTMKENVRTRLYDLAQKDIIDRLGLENRDGRLYFSDNKKLLKLLRDEATNSGNYTQNEINSLKLDEHGDFVWPLELLSAGKRFEGLLNSVISSAVQLHNPGTSLVQASGVGTKLDFSKITNHQKSDIIFTDKYDPEKGLQYMRNENGQVHAAQVFVSQFLRDENGKLIDLSKFVKEKDGRKVLDTDKIPEKVMQMIGARIPNQGHSSDLPIEVAGFLPDYMANTVIVPDGITAQMGSDFDVDKLYTYLSTLKLEKDENGNVTRIKPVDYDLGKYDGTAESLKDFDRDQLNELYKDIHWGVLTHPEGFKKVTRSIDLPEVAQEVARLSFLNSVPDHWSPLDMENQIALYNSNKGGKTGTAVFASLGSFLADNQDKEIFRGYHDENGNAVRVPIFIKREDGSLLSLSEISKEGSVRTPNGVRSKMDNNNIALGESVDNTKNQNMGVFGWHPRVLNALAGFIALSSPDGEIHDISFGTRLFLQESVKRYVQQYESMQDSFADNREANVGSQVMNAIKADYISRLSEEAQGRYETEEAPDKAVSAKELLDMLEQKHSGAIDESHTIVNGTTEDEDFRDAHVKSLDDYYLNQLHVLDLYSQFDETGREIMGANTAAYIYNKGLGASVTDVKDSLRKLKSLSDNRVLANLDQLAGNVWMDRGEYHIAPKGENGASLEKSLFMARDIYKQIYPMNFSTAWFDKVLDNVFALSGIDKNTVGSERFKSLHDQVFSGVKNYIFTHPKLGIAESIPQERERLLMDRGDNESLGTRLTKLKTSEEELKGNYFIDNLYVNSSTKPGEPTLIRYKDPYRQEINELKNTQGFVSLMLSGNPELNKLAKDLVKYSIITGNEQNATGFAKFIPSEYFLMDETFAKNLKTLSTELKNNGEFERQYIQNNPGRAARIAQGDFNAFVKASRTMGETDKDVAFRLTGDDAIKYLVPKSEDDAVAGMGDDAMFNEDKFPDYLSFKDGGSGAWKLYEKVDGVDGNTYKQLNLLGTTKAGAVEYAFGEHHLESSFAYNRTAKQVLDLAMANPDNPYHALPEAELKSRTRDIAMGDVATQYIGANPAGATNVKNNTKSNLSIWGDKANTGHYSTEDTVMITGPRLGDKLDNTEDITSELISKLFDEHYKPLLQKAVGKGADLVIGNAGGMDSYVRSYLKQFEGYKEVRSELGYSRYSNKNVVDDENIDFDNHDADTISIPAGEKDTADNISDDQLENMAPEMSDDQANAFTSMFKTNGKQADPKENITEDTLDLSNFITESQKQNPVMKTETIKNVPLDTPEQRSVLQAPEEVLHSFLPDPKGNNKLGDVLSNIAKNSDNPFYKTFAEMLQKSGVEDLNVIVSQDQPHPGWYDRQAIFIHPEFSMDDNQKLTPAENLQNTIMHEVVHGYTEHILNALDKKSNDLNAQERMYGVSLKVLFNDTKKLISESPEHKDAYNQAMSKLDGDQQLSQKDKSLYYGLSNIHEFVAQMVTDKDFQNLLNETKLNKNKDLSILGRFREILTRLFENLSKALGHPIEKGSALEKGMNDLVQMIGSNDIDEYDEDFEIPHPEGLTFQKGEEVAVKGQRNNYYYVGKSENSEPGYVHVSEEPNDDSATLEIPIGDLSKANYNPNQLELFSLRTQCN